MNHLPVPHAAPVSGALSAGARLVQSAMGALVAALALVGGPAHAAHPAKDAQDVHYGRAPDKNVIQNKFFMKGQRFEVAPSIGMVPNNSFVTNVYGGAVLAYHFSETFAAEGAIVYAPNTGVGGVKGLTKTLVAIAHDSSATGDFKQPLDRLQLGALFAARWTPVYGKINLVGESVANFDLYGTAGVGVLTMAKDTATYNPEFSNNPEVSPVLVNEQPPVEAYPAFTLGIGLNFFITQSVAFKIDARSAIYVADEPDYGNEINGRPVELESRVYAPFLTTAGVSIFVPKMKARQTSF